VPVPYSGDFSGDGHTNHQGAWPADVYYGDMYGLWTDSSVTDTNAERSRNWNIPGDGKFDQSSPPGGVTLEIGRVDMFDMTCFSNKNPSRSEEDLLRQYLNKDHAFRLGRLPVTRRALMCDNFTDKGTDPVGSSGWRNFSSFFGSDHVTEVGWSNYFPTVTSGSYLWTFGSGGGQYYTCTGIGSSDDFALHDIQAVFTMWVGSYFGDWDNESNFLRAPLGSTTFTLASCYVGFPQWLYHPMAVGETLGYCARLTQNNVQLYPPINPGAGLAHICLLGDPSLRMHPVQPATALAATVSSNGVILTWIASSDPEVLGYNIYRAPSLNGPFTRLNGDNLVENCPFLDTTPAVPAVYMVRAIKLEQSASGTYYNASVGALAFVNGTAQPPPGLSIVQESANVFRLRVLGAPGQAFVLSASPDLSRWEPLLTNSLQEGTADLIEPAVPAQARQFYQLSIRPSP
jgi:hypothetical protein